MEKAYMDKVKSKLCCILLDPNLLPWIYTSPRSKTSTTLKLPLLEVKGRLKKKLTRKVYFNCSLTYKYFIAP